VCGVEEAGVGGAMGGEECFGVLEEVECWFWKCVFWWDGEVEFFWSCGEGVDGDVEGSAVGWVGVVGVVEDGVGWWVEVDVAVDEAGSDVRVEFILVVSGCFVDGAGLGDGREVGCGVDGDDGVVEDEFCGVWFVGEEGLEVGAAGGVVEGGGVVGAGVAVDGQCCGAWCAFDVMWAGWCGAGAGYA